jgi:two-component system, sporulation sensor kinase D
LKYMKSINPKNCIGVILFCIVSAILWSAYDLSKQFRRNERVKMELLAEAYHRLSETNLERDVTLEMKIIESNYEIPMIVTNELGAIVMHRNLNAKNSENDNFLEEELALMKEEEASVEINYLEDKKYIVYYRDSNLLVRLKYYPLTLILILFLFSGVVYLVFRSNKIAEQNKLWSGMAKETAHQIGTPLSSLMGWVELMKMQNTAPEISSEVEKDVERLNVIAARFSQIGSVPAMTEVNLTALLQKTIVYFKSRSSKNVLFDYKETKEEVIVHANEQLFSWVFENLIKNGIDAMAGKGTLAIELSSDAKNVKIQVRDTGKGMNRKQFKKIFIPGYTTRKRGWGLGLSLSKRIVEDYHKGKIYVKKSVLGKGTVFEILLPVS